MINNYYLVFRNSEGVVDAINKQETGESLPLPLEGNEDHPLIVELRSLEAQHGELDVSDRPVEPETLEAAKLAKQKEIIEAAKEAQTALVADYAPAEQASWDKKLAQAEKIIESNDFEDAPILAIEAKVFSGATTADELLTATLFLATKIKSKSEQLYAISAQISGKRTKLWNQLQAAKSFEELHLVTWD
jgi:hypothetical protein